MFLQKLYTQNMTRGITRPARPWPGDEPLVTLVAEGQLRQSPLTLSWALGAVFCPHLTSSLVVTAYVLTEKITH